MTAAADTAAHVLDRVVWNALTTRQAYLAEGDAGRALRMRADHGLFAATADRSDACVAALGGLVGPAERVAMVEADWRPEAPAGLTARAMDDVWQMLCEGLNDGVGGAADRPVVDLGEAEAAEMLALAQLTQPGPFFARTHRLGRFVGIKDEAGRLMAMAGERLQPEGFVEVSGVCTHPDARGRGYGGALSRIVAERVFARGETPFLHVFAANVGAIGLYEALGFKLRRVMSMTVLSRD